jgi:ketosteroid isomerase-like protein
MADGKVALDAHQRAAILPTVASRELEDQAPTYSGAAADFVGAWRRFASAFDARDDDAALAALKAWIDAWDRCFWASDFDAFGVAYWPDVEMVNRSRLPGGFDFSGIEGFRRVREDIADVLSNFRFEITGMRRSGNRFVGLGRMRTRGRYTGIVFRFPAAVLWTYRDGRIARIEPYLSQRGALAALSSGD